VIERPRMKHLISVAKAAGMDVGLTDGSPKVLYLTWHGKRERINEIVVRDYGRNLEAGAHILSHWIENRPKKELV